MIVRGLITPCCNLFHRDQNNCSKGLNLWNDGHAGRYKEEKTAVFNVSSVYNKYIFSILLEILQISNFEYLMQLNTLAGRSYNDITQVNIIIIKVIIFQFKCLEWVINVIFVCSTPFFHGFLQITSQSIWILQILRLSEIYQRSQHIFF